MTRPTISTHCSRSLAARAFFLPRVARALRRDKKIHRVRGVRFVLFDTTFFIDLERETAVRQPGAAAAFLVAHRGQAKRVATVTLGEFAVGGAGGPALRRFFRGYLPMPLGREDAIYAGRLQARLSLELGENDLWIAGLALRHGLSLVTRDAAFSRVPGLRVLAY